MKNKVVFKRYADAFVAFASPRIGLARCVDEMRGLKWLLRENPQLEQVLRAPEIPSSEKILLVDRIFGAHYSQELCVFLKHLIVKWRIAGIAHIADYVREAYAQGEAVAVTLRTTFPMELDLVERIKGRLQKKLSRDVNLYLELDPDLLGGVQVVVGNKVIDGSVRNRLQEFKKKLLKI